MFWRPYTFVVGIIAALVLSLVFINSRYQTVKKNHQILKQQYHVQREAVRLQQQKIEALHQLDIPHTEELINAKEEIAKLNNAIRAGTKRLHVSAVCRASKTATPKSRYDETTPRLSEEARQNYFRLRAMIIENQKQTEYLQKYIKLQCK